MDNFNFGSSQFSRSEVLQLFARLSVASIITFYSIKWMMKQLDPTSKEKKNARNRAEQLLKRLNEESRYKIGVQQFNDYELVIASHLVVPSDISVSWRDIAGLDVVIQELRETVVFPVRYKNFFSQSKLWQSPKGVLLFGPPGCGKTLIAKATAKEAGMRFINLDVSILTDKWYGESQKLASAVFSLAVKIQPCIIFIDEIDSFLRNRTANDHEATAMMKTQFMMLWDGLITSADTTVLVMGATNRPQDLDKAILRRMPTQFHIGLPTELQRLEILKLMLDGETASSDINLSRLATISHGFSGSDLKEMCRDASVQRIRQYMRSHTSEDFENHDKNIVHNCPPITMNDLLKSLEKIKESKNLTGLLNSENRLNFH